MQTQTSHSLPPVESLLRLRKAHTSARSALRAVTGTDRASIVLREALNLLWANRDTAYTGLLDLFCFDRHTLFRPIARRLRRFSTGPEWNVKSIEHLLIDLLQLWSLPPTLQGLQLALKHKVTAYTVLHPWFNDPRIVSIMEDGMVGCKMLILDAEPSSDGPSKLQFLYLDDPMLDEVATAAGHCGQWFLESRRHYPPTHHYMSEWNRHLEQRVAARPVLDIDQVINLMMNFR